MLMKFICFNWFFSHQSDISKIDKNEQDMILECQANITTAQIILFFKEADPYSSFAQ